MITHKYRTNYFGDAQLKRKGVATEKDPQKSDQQNFQQTTTTKVKKGQMSREFTCSPLHVHFLTKARANPFGFLKVRALWKINCDDVITGVVVVANKKPRWMILLLLLLLPLLVDMLKRRCDGATDDENMERGGGWGL